MPACTPFVTADSIAVGSVQNGALVLDRPRKRLFVRGDTGGAYLAGINTDTEVLYNSVVSANVNSPVGVDPADGAVYSSSDSGFIIRKVHKIDPVTLTVSASSLDTAYPTGQVNDLRAGSGRVAMGTAGQIVLLDSNTLAILGTAGTGGISSRQPLSCAIDSDGNGWFLLSGLGGSDPLLDRMTGGGAITTYTLSEATYGQPGILAFDPITKYLLIGGSDTGKLFFWDTVTHALVTTLAGVVGDSGTVGAFRSSIADSRAFWLRTGYTVTQISLDSQSITCTTDISALQPVFNPGDVWDGGLFDGTGYALWVSVHFATNKVQKLIGFPTLPVSSLGGGVPWESLYPPFAAPECAPKALAWNGVDSRVLSWDAACPPTLTWGGTDTRTLKW